MKKTITLLPCVPNDLSNQMKRSRRTTEGSISTTTKRPGVVHVQIANLLNHNKKPDQAESETRRK